MSDVDPIAPVPVEKIKCPRCHCEIMLLPRHRTYKEEAEHWRKVAQYYSEALTELRRQTGMIS